MVKFPFQNNKNWASYKCLVRKSEKMCLSRNISKIWDVEFQKCHFLCSYVPEFHIYVCIHGNNTFPSGYISKSVGMCLSHVKKIESWLIFISFFFFFVITMSYYRIWDLLEETLISWLITVNIPHLWKR